MRHVVLFIAILIQRSPVQFLSRIVMPMLQCSVLEAATRKRVDARDVKRKIPGDECASCGVD